MIYLDTHLAIWLYFGKSELIPDAVFHKMDNAELYLSPMVCLEIQYLYEVKRFKVQPKKIIHTLYTDFDIKICEKPFNKISEKAMDINWTRDPFDRIIVAHAALDSDILLTKDVEVQKNYKFAEWDRWEAEQ